MENYFDEVLKALDNMTDAEFDELLMKSGLEDCPIEEYQEEYSQQVTITDKPVLKLRNKTKPSWNKYVNYDQYDSKELKKVG